MACRIDIETAILDQVFNEVVEDRNTYTREADNIIVINSKADNAKSKTSNRQAAYKIAQERLDFIKKSFKGQVTGTISETNDYEPIKIKLFVNPEYIEYEYSKLPESQQTDPKDYLNLENEGNYTTSEDGDVIIKNEQKQEDREIIGLPNKLSQPQITQGPIDYSQEPKFRERNPKFNSEAYVNTVDKFGRAAQIDETLTPFLSETREKAQQHSAEFIADSFKSKDKPNERKFNRPTNLPEGFQLLQRTGANEYTSIASGFDNVGVGNRESDTSRRDNGISLYKGVFGRSFNSLETLFNKSDKVDGDTLKRYSNLRVIQSLSENVINNGIIRKIGLGEVRIVNSKFGTVPNSPLFVNRGILYINEDTWSKSLQDKYKKGVNLDEYIDMAVFEECIHLVDMKLHKQEDLPLEELKNEEFRIIDKFYQDVNSQQIISKETDKPNVLRELIRMKVQKDLAGVSTEDLANSSFTKDSFINDIVNKIWDFIMSLFKDKLVKTNKIAEEVKDYIKGLDIKKVGSELDEILGLAAQRQNEINYGLKATQILSSDRAKQVFEKGEKFDWDLNKILSELQIPKPQKELIKSFNTEDREKIIANLLANYSYTVEINTAKTREAIDDEYRYYEENSKYFRDSPYDGKEEVTKEEFERNKYKENKNSSYYSNLTVPGGTNYTEQEISTPLITPSIKGHAQFSTDNGIGWFRSDDKAPQIKGWQKDEADWMDSESAVYNAITPNDKIIWGHPTIGKSFLKEKGDNSFITLDDDYANEVNAFIDKNRGNQTRQEYKGSKPKEYNKFMLDLFDRLKIQAKKEGKKLFVSNTNILKERMSEFDKVITMPKDEFKKRFDKRGSTYGFEDWKSDIDKTVDKVDSNKVIETTKYLSDLLEPQVKTRRILEVQSDIFQKGRDIKSPDEIIQELQKSGKLEIKCS